MGKKNRVDANNQMGVLLNDQNIDADELRQEDRDELAQNIGDQEMSDQY